MTIPVFTAGTVLTAAELNTALSASANLLAQQPNTWPFPQTFDGTIIQTPGQGANNSSPFAQYGDLFSDAIVTTPTPAFPTSTTLSSTAPALDAYVLGQRVAYAGGSYTVGASATSYLDLSNTGVLTVSTSGTVTTNSLRLATVTSSATAITGVVVTAFSDLTIGRSITLDNGGVPVGQMLPSVANISTLRNSFSSKMGTSVNVLGYYSDTDGGGGIYNYNPSDTTSGALLAGSVSPIPEPSGAPTLTSASGGALAATTYYVATTYVSAAGESLPSPSSSLAVATDYLLGVDTPTAVTGVTGYNVYVGLAAGSLYLQNSTPVAIGTNWTEPTTGLLSSVGVPTINTCGSTLTVSLVNGTLKINQNIQGSGVPYNTWIVGGTGQSWTVTNSFSLTSSSLTSDNGGSFIVNITGERWDLVPGESGIFDSSRWGFIDGGVADNSSQWMNILEAANTQYSAAIAPGFPIATGKVKIRSGNYYVARGANINTNINLSIEGNGKENTGIIVGAQQYLITCPHAIYQLSIRGISFFGGDGYLAHTGTGGNVQGIMYICDNNFTGYTTCAIGSLSTDFPYWKILRNFFFGTTLSKGVVLMGGNDLSEIIGNSFLENLYHIKLGLGGSDVRVENNDFIHFKSHPQGAATIWVIPSTTSNTAGVELIICHNKFGNENLNTADYAILVADEGTGTNSFDMNHSTAASTGYLSGVHITGNQVTGSGGMTVGFVYSYTPNITFCKISNISYGGVYPYIVQYDPVVSFSNEDRLIDSNICGWYPTSIDSYLGQASSRPSTAPFSDDPLGVMQGLPGASQPWASGEDISYSDITVFGNGNTTINPTGSPFSGGNVSSVETTDAVGGMDASILTFTASTGTAYFNIESGTYDAQRMGWIEIDIKQSTSNPLGTLDIYGYLTTLIPFRRVVNIPPYWMTIKIPFLAPISDAFAIQVTPADYSSPTAVSVMIGRVKFYQAQQPMHSGSFPSAIGPGGFGSGTGAPGTLGFAPQKIVFGNSAPSAGHWNIGDIVWHQSPGANNASGWRCVASGTPGTWVVFGAFIPELSVSSTTTAGAITVTAAQLWGRYLADGATQTTAFTVTTDTAVNILAAVPNAVVGTSFKWRFINNDQSATGYAGTLAGGSGVTVGTILPNPAVPKGGYEDYVFTFTAIGATPTLTVEAVGGNSAALL